MLKPEKFNELAEKDPELKKYYTLQDNGFYKFIADNENREKIKEKFKKLGFSALNFTDSRSKYQFYDLSRLWKDINTAIENKLPDVEFDVDEIQTKPQETVELEGKDMVLFERLMNLLNDCDDVDQVYHNVSNYDDGEEE